MDVAAVLLDDVVHRRREPGGALGALLLRQVFAEDVLVRPRPALAIDVPGYRLVAAADDAVVAYHVLHLGVLRRDRQAVGVALVGHGDPPSITRAARC